MDVPAPANLSLVLPADTPEAAFDMIAAANLQPAATLDPDPEELAAVEDLDNEPEVNMDQVLSHEEVEDEISLEEVTQVMSV